MHPSSSFPPAEASSNPSEQLERFQERLLQQSLIQLQNLIEPNIPFQTHLNRDFLYESCELVGQPCGLHFRYPLVEEEAVEASLEQSIHRLCLHSQVYYRKVKLQDDWWTTFNFAFVGFYGPDYQPVALIPHFSKQFQMINPATGQTTFVDQSVASAVQLEGFLFYRPLPEHKLTAHNLWTFSIWYRFREWLVFVGLAIACLLVPFIIPMLTNLLFDSVIPNRQIELLTQIGLGAGLLTVTTLIFSYSRESLLLRLMGLIDHDLELAIWQRMMNLPVHFFRKYGLYDLFTLTSAVTLIRQLATSQVIMVFLNGGFALLFLFMLFYYGQGLAWVGLGILAVELAALLIALPFVIRYGKQMLAKQITSSERTFEIIQSISKIRLAAAEIPFFHRWEQAFSRMKRTELTLQLLKMKMSVFNAFWSTASMGIIYASVIYFFLEAAQLSATLTAGKMTLGSFMAFMAVFGFLSSSLHQIYKTALQVSSIAPLWERIKTFSSAEVEDYASKADPGVLKGAIRVEEISFSYQTAAAPLFQNVSLTIPAGKCVAFVGLSGCGKSTLLRLLIGFEKPLQGAIYYDDCDLEGLNLQLVRAQMGIGLQSGFLLDGTIRDNINSGRYYSDADVWKAVKIAGVSSFIQELPMGLDTVLTNGGLALSGGQRQMILLARALVGNPKVLILDEATNAIDSQMQLEIHRNLSQLPMTRILVTQRLDTLRSGIDLIYVLDQGRIVAQGSFSELENSNPFFAKLVESREP